MPVISQGVTSPARCHDDLGLDDYRRIVEVMDTVAGATSHADLCERLLRALAREFGWTNASVLDEESPGLAEPVPAGARLAGAVPIPVRGPAGTLLRIRVAAAPGATTTIGVPLYGRRVGPREHSISLRLGRLLAPSFRAHVRAGSGATTQWSLTDRERQIAELVAAGLTNRQLAEHLHVTVDTVKKHITSVLRKTGCTTRTRLAVLWRQTT